MHGPKGDASTRSAATTSTLPDLRQHKLAAGEQLHALVTVGLPASGRHTFEGLERGYLEELALARAATRAACPRRNRSDATTLWTPRTRPLRGGCADATWPGCS